MYDIFIVLYLFLHTLLNAWSILIDIMYWACQLPLGSHFSKIWMCTLLLLPWWRIYSQWSSGIWSCLFIPFWFLWLNTVLWIWGKFGLKSSCTHYLFMFSKLLAVHGLVFCKMVEQRFLIFMEFLLDQTWK